MKSLGDRMKENYEDRQRFYLLRRTPVILRIDGVGFSRWTKKVKCTKPFDKGLSDAMNKTAVALMKDIQGAVCAYHQSDEISILLVDFNKFSTDAWYDNNVSKLCSVTASKATGYFNKYFEYDNSKFAEFDCRAFNLPKEEVTNYFIWRQSDWRRNSVMMYAMSFFSHKQLDRKGVEDVKQMLIDNGTPWDDIEPGWRFGAFIASKGLGELTINECTDIREDREYIDDLLVPEEI